MSHADLWITLALLGAYHGINPAMGWLFAVSNGMQEGSRRGVYRSLIPIAIGHEASIVVVAGLAIGASAVIDPGILRIVAASSLVAFGIFRFVKPHAHFRWTTMSPSNRELTLWSFLMSSAHGAGLIVAPVIVGLSVGADHEHHDVAMMSAAPIGAGALGVMVHVGRDARRDVGDRRRRLRAPRRRGPAQGVAEHRPALGGGVHPRRRVDAVLVALDAMPLPDATTVGPVHSDRRRSRAVAALLPGRDRPARAAAATATRWCSAPRAACRCSS